MLFPKANIKDPCKQFFKPNDSFHLNQLHLSFFAICFISKIFTECHF